jgi:cobalt-zinc-cadmium efflux system protein
LSCHAVIEDLPPSASDGILRLMNDVLEERFHISHTTIQFENVTCENAAEICSSPLQTVGGHHH